MDVNLNQDASLKDQAIKEIKSIRSRLWDENVLYTLEETNKEGTKIRDVAKAYGYANKQAYVNGIKWSYDLELISIQRVLEQPITGMTHSRPDGSDFQSFKTKNGVISYGENIARYTEPMTAAQAFGQWSFSRTNNNLDKSEYEYLKENKGVFEGVTNGHLHLILDPTYKYIGYANINTNNHKWNYGLASFSQDVANNSEKTSGISTEAKQASVSADFRKTLKESIKNAQFSIDAAENILENYPNTVKNVRGKLLSLIEDTKEIIRQSQALLNK